MQSVACAGQVSAVGFRQALRLFRPARAVVARHGEGNCTVRVAGAREPVRLCARAQARVCVCVSSRVRACVRAFVCGRMCECVRVVCARARVCVRVRAFALPPRPCRGAHGRSRSSRRNASSSSRHAAHTPARTHTHTHARTHANTHTHNNTHTHTPTHTRARTHTHARAYYYQYRYEFRAARGRNAKRSSSCSECSPSSGSSAHIRERSAAPRTGLRPFSLASAHAPLGSGSTATQRRSR